MPDKNIQNYAKELEERGDALSQLNKYEEALNSYRESHLANPTNLSIYDKLITTHAKIEREWEQEDFIEVMSWTMQKQELENPELQDVYARLTPEYGEILRAIQTFLVTSPEERELIFQKIKGYGQSAVLPLMDTLSKLAELANSPSQEKSPE